MNLGVVDCERLIPFLLETFYYLTNRVIIAVHIGGVKDSCIPAGDSPVVKYIYFHEDNSLP